MSKGLGKVQGVILRILREKAVPMSFADMLRFIVEGARAQGLLDAVIDPFRARHLRRALGSLEARGDVVITKGMGGPGDPRFYTHVNPAMRLHAKMINRKARSGRPMFIGGLWRNQPSVIALPDLTDKPSPF